jgi:hypothetical protein
MAVMIEKLRKYWKNKLERIAPARADQGKNIVRHLTFRFSLSHTLFTGLRVLMSNTFRRICSHNQFLKMRYLMINDLPVTEAHWSQINFHNGSVVKEEASPLF